MLSRLAPRIAVGRPALAALRAASTSAPAAKPAEAGAIKEGPERDLVNFPRRVRPELPDRVRLGFIPEEWFQAFYKKTGVTGPYMFGTGFLTFLFSKEIYVMEHEFYTAITLFLFGALLVKKVGPGLSEYLDKRIDEYEDGWREYRANQTDGLVAAIEEEKKQQWHAEGQMVLFEAKKENVALQLEAAFRERQMTVYNEVKRRLDYQVDTQNVAQGFQQKHLVGWVVDQVKKSITPQQEQDAIKQCLAELKGLAAKA
ncbi:ATP synthase subunit b, mitochondrial-like [Pollicipes pollicipes]|uniref:ATP synthase subunit b, mitochondrial-like n=1 Tax=Pollicipes pollicipes TaxID=41117 RepID=UPI001884F6AE|nr:ATP synthase subunit b, mitochondrial-like [Pollicipes pollicipes]XP_037070464.1 ATP synthase subunit b, mitochondrial-like [Pollicipes pollicipes]